MITKEKIGDKIFVTQTTHYIYKSEEDYENDKFSHTISNENVFNKIKKYYKDLLKKTKWKNQ